MLKDLDYSSLEIVSAVKNISDMQDYKSVLTTITFLKKEDYQVLEGIEELVYKLNLENEGKYIKLQASYLQNEANLVDLNNVVKVVYNHPEQKYRNVTRNCDDASTSRVLQDIEFIESVFDKSTDKKLYM